VYFKLINKEPIKNTHLIVHKVKQSLAT